MNKEEIIKQFKYRIESIFTEHEAKKPVSATGGIGHATNYIAWHSKMLSIIKTDISKIAHEMSNGNQDLSDTLVGITAARHKEFMRKFH